MIDSLIHWVIEESGNLKKYEVRFTIFESIIEEN